MRRQSIQETSDETTGFSQCLSQRTRFAVVLWLGLILLSTNLGVGAAQEKPKTGSSERVDALITQLTTATDPVLRISAVELLGEMGERQATKPLVAALRDPDLNVQKTAALALGLIKDRSAVNPLIALLRETSDKATTAFALGLIRDRCAVEPLIEILIDRNAKVRTNAAIALGRLGDPRAVEPLLALPHDKDHAAVNNPDDDPLRHVAVREEKGLRAGGFAILMTKQLVDELVYNERHNELMFVKFLP